MIPLLLIVLLFILILSFAIGGQDESMASIYGSGSLKLKTAIIIAGFCAFLGVLFLSEAVGKTIGSNLLSDQVEYETLMILAVLMATSTWLIIGSKTGVPISTTHTVVGAIFGISFIITITQDIPYIETINWFTLAMIAIGWIISPILGYCGAILIQPVINRIFKHYQKGLIQVEKLEKIFRYILIFIASINQFARAGNDAAKAIGIFYSLTQTGEIDINYAPLFILLCAIAFVFGLFVMGRHVVQTVGSTTGGQMRPSEALAADVSTAIIVFVATLLGLPVSGGHIIVFALIGSSKIKGERPDGRVLKKMSISWILTFPLAAGLSAFYYFLLYLF